MNWNCLRGEIYYIDFGENMGSEENGIRPALVIQNDKGNKYSNTVIVASITTKIDKIIHISLGLDCNDEEK